MKIVILTEGGSSIGLGHISRCLALAQEFNNRGIKPTFVINGDEAVCRFLGSRDHQMLDWVNNREALFRNFLGTDIVIIDSYLADSWLYADIVRMFPDALIVSIDDDARIEYPFGIVINPSIYGEKLDYSQKNRRALLTGKDYVILRDAFTKLPEKKINQDIENVLITFGGTYYSDLMHQIEDCFKGRFNFLKVDPSKQQLTAEEMAALMLKADICISGGGQTLCELARVGLPTIGICFGDNQIPGLLAWQEIGFIKYIGKYNGSQLFDRIRAAMTSFSSAEERRRSSQIGRMQVDGGGAQRIVDMIMAQRNVDKIPMNTEEVTLREVCSEDCKDLWQWRNDLRVRQACFDSKEIPFEDHTRWFEEKYKDKGNVMYIAENGNKGKLGQVRFEVAQNKEAKIHINLNPIFLGRGLGHRIIKLASRVFLERNLWVQCIVAEIVADNIISQKAFVKAGYEMVPVDTVRNGKKAFIYRFVLPKEADILK